MAFHLDPKPDDMFFERKQPPHASAERADDVHKDLFDTISEAHYLPELGGPHDEALLESLVEKGCEDNQILGQALDKLAHLVTDYEEEDDMLLGAAPVSDIINRLEQSLESPGRSSMSAAQGLLDLHQLTDHLPSQSEHADQQPYLSEDIFVQPDQSSSMSGVHDPQPDTCQATHLQYEQNAEMRQQYNQEYGQTTEARLKDSNVHYNQNAVDPHVQYNENTDQSHMQYDQNATQRLNDETRIEDPRAQYDKNAECMLENNGAENNVTVYSDISEEGSLNPTASYDTTFEEHPPVEPVVAQTDDTASSEGPNQETETENCDTNHVEIKTEMETESEATVTIGNVDFKDLEEANSGVELVATDLSVNSLKPKHSHKHKTPLVITTSVVETTNSIADSVSEKSEEFPRDLSVQRRFPTPHASPRRTDVPRAPSRESDAMQSPQPSGIPAVPSSPEIFTVPLTKSKQTLFLESLLSSPSPKMYTSEVTITKQQCEPLNLGKHRKSASPTVSSCSDEIRKPTKDYGEPQEKRIKHESMEDLAKISKVFNKCSDEQIPDSAKQKKPDRPPQKASDDVSPLKQLHILKTNPDFNIPDPLLVPKDKLNHILEAPGREIPALLIQRPELRLPEAFAYPAVLQDPDILVISLSQLENILENDAKKLASLKSKENKAAPKTSSSTEHMSTPQLDASQPKPIPSMDALAGDIDAATSAALNQMLWLPYLSQLEAMAACSQNMDFMKALNSSGYSGPNYPDVSQMFNPNAGRGFMGPSGFPMMPSMDYDNRLQFAMWQEAMNHANATAAAQRAKPSPLEAQMKDLAKSSDVQNPYVHSTKSHQSKSHSAARTSPIAHNYNTNQRAMPHNPYLQGMYPGMAPNMRPNMPLPGLQIPYFNPNLMSQQRSPRTSQQKSPTSPYYPNNNYLPSKQPEGHQRRLSTSSQESPRPRISVKSLQNLLEPSAAAATGQRRHSHGTHGSSGHSQAASASLGRRREEPEVGSTTPLGEPVMPHHLPPMPPHPHDPSSFHLWHPLFGNQKSYASPWSWTTVTATGD